MASIIIPAFNAAATLQEAIDSVLEQTYRDWQLIIVDDGSTDETLSIARQAMRSDPRIMVVSQRNQGVSAARNTGMEKSKYPYIAFLDADDCWLPNKLERQEAFMRLRNVAFSFTAYRKFSPVKISPIIHAPYVVSYTDLLKTRPINTSAVMFDRRLLDMRMPDLPANSGIHEDLLTWLSILKKAPAYGLDEDLVRVRIGHQSRSSNKARSALNVWRVYRHYERLSPLEASWYFGRYVLNAMRVRLAHKFHN